MKQYYECHITLRPRFHLAQDVLNLGWTFSQIDGDPDLGEGVKAYATKHFNTRKRVENVIAELTRTAFALREIGYYVLREKVELVIYDKRSGK